jgi:hypothetical protein
LRNSFFFIQSLSVDKLNSHCNRGPVPVIHKVRAACPTLAAFFAARLALSDVEGVGSLESGQIFEQPTNYLYSPIFLMYSATAGSKKRPNDFPAAAACRMDVADAG